jgi:coenzyme F420 hydrogenase subunit beta
MIAAVMSNQGLQQLHRRVIERDLCTLCGACLSLCPYLRAHEGRVVKLHDCDLEQGRCFARCPRTDPVAGNDGPMGPVERVLTARATDEPLRARASNGGVVTALVTLALREDLIDAALLTSSDGGHLPRTRVARTPDEVLACAGTCYVANPTLEALGGDTIQANERVGVVGLPCQVQALSKIGQDDQRVVLALGLFCTWALLPHDLFGGLQVRRLEITPPPDRRMIAHTAAGEVALSLDQVRPHIRPGCRACADLTSERADLSVGSVEDRPGWNTVVVRTARGRELLELALHDEVLEQAPLLPANLAHLEQAARDKKRRAKEATR